MSTKFAARVAGDILDEGMGCSYILLNHPLCSYTKDAKMKHVQNEL
jgi:hypothetical protein